MALNHSPKIVTDGLTIYLDAANTRSYPGSGSTWTDLTGNGFNATLNNSPTHNTSIGYFSFNGTNQYADHTVPQLTGGTDNFTFEVWFKMRTLPTATYDTNGHIWGGENGNDIVMYVNPAGIPASGQSLLNLVYDDSRYYNANFSTYGHFTSGFITADTWVHWVCQGRASDNTIAHYLNGSLDRTFTAVYAVQETKIRNTDAMIAYDSRYSKYSTLDCAVIKEYNRILSASEVAQNYTALRGRFGL